MGDCGIHIMPKRKKTLVSWRFQDDYVRLPRKTLGSEIDDPSDIERGKELCEDGGDTKDRKDVKCRIQVVIMSKRRKTLVSWRFQRCYKRLFSKAFNLETESVGSLKNRNTSVQFSSRMDGIAPNLGNGEPPTSANCQSTPVGGEQVLRRYPSRVRVSAECNVSSGMANGPAEVASGQDSAKTRTAGEPVTFKDNIIDEIATRKSVRESLREFQKIYRKLLEEEEDSKSKQTRIGTAPDMVAFKLFRERSNGLHDDRKYVGKVPGVHIGDVFHLRVELCVVGLHRQHRVGIDYLNQGGKLLAVSIVSYMQCSGSKNDFDILIYSGSVIATNNQKLEGGNLALKRSMETGTPVRVIYGFIRHQSDKYRETKTKKLATYIYGGQYLVEKYWMEKKDEICMVCKFRLRRISGQAKLDIQEILKSRRSETFSGLYIDDISQGKEKVPISAVNAIDEEYLVPFNYNSKIQYPLLHKPTPPSGCDCTDGCSDSEKCACAVKNGGEIPFNNNGAVVEAKPLIYECGPSCKCPPTCHNRVSQHGIKFPLQVFKTKLMGWGVRSLTFIPSGSYVCEYVGDLLEDEEAQKKTNDDYLFAIGNNYYDESLWEGLSSSIPSLQKGAHCEGEEGGFAVDASECGNVGRFINHSCTPNLYAQNLLYDHDDMSMPHIMFFASENIPPLVELTYHYNYTVDQVYDSNGNIKRKNCYCGSIECTGRLY
uniref:Histone-lysine N-methyltransferase, H3 lysine-9 specific SUVH6-like n=1 Tax=Ananas comosus var. bracteatus TaxID=296719 RepID=A0A6V7PW21_ANACO|nr:unnamed protein product [Ananas comosus var. bracteatus]